MKKFVSENWYKLMIALSMLIFSVGFFLNSITPIYANQQIRDRISLKKSVGEIDSDFMFDVVEYNGYAHLMAYRFRESAPVGFDFYWMKKVKLQ